MEKKEQIKQVVRDFHVREPAEVRSRDVDLPVGSGEIISLIGARRSAKTSILFDISEEKTREREIKGLVEACEKFGLQSGTIVTSDMSENITIGSRNIRFVPFYKMFLEEH